MTSLAAPAPLRTLAPLRLVVRGIIVVAVDLNVGSVDVLLDPVGYAVVAVGLSRLAPVHVAFRRARVAALVGLAAAVLSMLLRRSEEVVAPSGGGLTTTSARLVEPLVPSAVETLAEAALVVLVCTALLALGLDARLHGWARTLRWALPATTLLGTGLALALAPLDGTAVESSEALAVLVAALAVVLVVAGVVLALWFLVLLWRAAAEPVARLP